MMEESERKKPTLPMPGYQLGEDLDRCDLCSKEIDSLCAKTTYPDCGHSYHLVCMKERGMNPFSCPSCEPKPLSSLYSPSPSATLVQTPTPSAPVPRRKKKRSRRKEPFRYTLEDGYGISSADQCKEWVQREEEEQHDRQEKLKNETSWIVRAFTSAKSLVGGSNRPRIMNLVQMQITPSKMATEYGILAGDFLEQGITIKMLQEQNYKYKSTELRDAFGDDFGANTLVAMGVHLIDFLHPRSPYFMTKEFSKKFNIYPSTPLPLLCPDAKHICETISFIPEKQKFTRLRSLGINAEYLCDVVGITAEDFLDFPLTYEQWRKEFGLTREQISRLDLTEEEMISLEWPSSVVEYFNPGYSVRLEQAMREGEQNEYQIDDDGRDFLYHSAEQDERIILPHPHQRRASYM